MTYTPRAMTTQEKTYIRTDGQYSSLYLGILNPPIIFTARVNQTFDTKDKVVEVAFDTSAGDLADVLPGMTLWVGSTAGAYDRGTCRIRKDPIAGLFYIGENSDIPWADELYLSVIDDFDIWARHLGISNNEPFMDHDIAYSNQHASTSPIPCIGPRLIPVFLDDDDLVTVSFDGSLSWTLPDTSVSSYVWAAPGNIAATGPLTATPTFQYDTPGTYRVSCRVYSANGNYTDAYAYILIFDRVTAPPITQFQMRSCGGSYSERGWKFQVTMWDEAALSSVVDRAQVVLFADDYYGTTRISIGQIADRENIIVIGRINGESILEDPDASTVDFTVETAAAWLKRITGFPIGIQNTTLPAAAWTEWFNLTVDRSLYHLFYWQSTVIPVIDIYLTEDTKISQEQYAPGMTSIFDQIGFLLRNTLLGHAGCDRFNRMFCEVDTQLTPVVERTDFPNIITLEKYDWRDSLPITRIPISSTSQVDLSGVVIDPPKEPKPIFSLAPGHVYTPLGKPVKQDRMLLSTQAKANDLAAMKLAWDNHLLEFSPDLAGNNRMLDVFPTHQYVRMTVAEDDTPREFIYSGNMLVREIQISMAIGAEPTGFLQVSWQGECETFPGNSTDGDLPDISDVPDTDFPIDPPPDDPDDPITIDDPTQIDNVQVLVPGTGVFYTVNFSSPPSEVIWYSMDQGFPDPETYAPLISFFDVSETGRCYCQVGFDSIWSAPAPGEPWVKVFDTTMIGNPEGYPFPREPRVIAFGINRDTDDELLIVAGLTVTIFSSFIAYTWKGDSSGVTQATPVFFNDAEASMGLYVGIVTYGDGTWVLNYHSGPFLGVNTIITFDSTGVTPSVAIPLTGTAYYHTRSRYSSNVILVPTASPIDISTDNGASFNPLATAPTPYLNSESFCSNTDGSIMLVGTQTIGMKRSEDGGVTWGPTSTLAAVTSIFNMGTDDDWLFAFVGQILYTPDKGDTFFYHTGDLQTYAGPFALITQIRFYSS